MAKRDFERKIAKNIKNNSKSLFKYAKSKSGVKPSVGPLIDYNGMLVSDDQYMSDLLNTFASVFTTEDYYNLPAAKKIFKGEDSEKLCSFTITPKMVKDKLIKLKMNKAPGIDLVGSRMLSEISEEISDIVGILLLSYIISP